MDSQSLILETGTLTRLKSGGKLLSRYNRRESINYGIFTNSTQNVVKCKTDSFQISEQKRKQPGGNISIK